MALIVFVGPSLGRTTVGQWPRITFRPPAECGDIARAVMEGSHAIGLIDGLFETCPSPWHKEILWGLSKGVVFFGAASMGALRAVELEPFGMIGIGRVFDAYRRGLLESDDEVAVLHGPAEMGYPTITEALVNFRASLEQACDVGVIGVQDMRTLIHVAKSLFYKDRTRERIWSAGAAAGVSDAVIVHLSVWLREHAIDVKRQDSYELLECLARYRPDHFTRRARPQFVNTKYFESLRERLSAS